MTRRKRTYSKLARQAGRLANNYHRLKITMLIVALVAAMSVATNLILALAL